MLTYLAAGNAYNSIANHPTTQSLANGPAAQRIGEEADKTSQEFSNVLNSRQIPDTTAANGQTLTHYHSMFYNILSVSINIGILTTDIQALTFPSGKTLVSQPLPSLRPSPSSSSPATCLSSSTFSRVSTLCLEVCICYAESTKFNSNPV